MVRRFVFAAAVAVSLGATAVVAQGCIVGASVGGQCRDDIPKDCCLCPWPDDCPPYRPEPIRTLPEWCDQYLQDGGTDGGDAGMTSFCSNGMCVPRAPDDWKHVAFFMQWPEPPPACPEDAPILAFEGSPAPPDRICPACLCDEPEGKCSLPATWTVSSANCDNPSGGVKTNFDPPTGWDGSCSGTNAIPQGKLCGGVPCAQSLTISLPVIDEKPCVSRIEGFAELPPLKAWNDGPRAPVGRACTSDKPLPGCSGSGCVETNSGFAACIMHDGDEVCPDGWIGERHVLYSQIDDSRECTTCGCDAPSGAVCKVKWETFAVPACAAGNFAGEISAGMPMTACYPLDPGVALASKKAEILNYTKGSCTPGGGEIIGDLKLDGQVTVCCNGSTM